MTATVIPFTQARTETPQVTVDVLLPVYNAEATIESAVLSVLAQTVRNIRVIAIDDGSTDRSNDILSAIAANDPRLVILEKPNSGIVDALNRGLAICTAEFVARQDADDISAPDRLEIQIAAFEANPTAVAISGSCEHIDADGCPLGSSFHICNPDDADFDAVPSVEPYLLHPFLMVRRTAIESVGGYRHCFHAEDTDLYWRLLRAGRLVNLDRSLGLMRLHAGSITNASVRNGRVSAINSQLAAISARRVAMGGADIAFPSTRIEALHRAGTLEAMIEAIAPSLEPAEATYLRDAASVKLLELANSRAFELEPADLTYIAARYRVLPSAQLRGATLANWAYRATLTRLLRTRQLARLRAFLNPFTASRTMVMRFI